MATPIWMWGVFFVVIGTLLTFDLGLLNRNEKEITLRESLWLSAGYIAISILFGFVLMYFLGARPAKDFFTGYCIEKSLSMDNIFVISMVFSHVATPRKYQYRVLFWGIIGVILLRGLLIGLGSALVHQFEWILYLFGILLIYTGFKMLFISTQKEKDMTESRVLPWLRRHIPITEALHGKRFFIRAGSRTGRKVWKATPLFLVLVFIELADVIFAIDSVPAVFAVTTDTFIVFTSNIFAILGLRALYFSLSAMLHRFAYLKYALALVLLFIGSKIMLMKIVKIHSGFSLAVTLILLLGGVVFSLYRTRQKAQMAQSGNGRI